MNKLGQGAALVGVVMAGVIGFMYAKSALFDTDNRHNIYGIWVEEGVPAYNADQFEVRENGIYMQGALKTSHYDYSGNKLIFTVGDKTYEYFILNNHTLRRDKPFNYSTLFVRKS